MILIFSAHLNSCKEEETNLPEEDFISTKYTGQTNAEDVILANVFSANAGTHVYYYGSTNAQGDPVNVKSVAFERTGSDTVYNFILDESDRIEYMYSIINGVKDSKLHRLTYTDTDSVYYSVYQYDWNTHVDSLLYIAGLANNNGIFSASTFYGKTSSVDGWMPELQAIGGAFNVAGGALAAVAGGAALGLGLSAWVAAAGTITIAIAWFGGDANAGVISNAPISGEPGSPSSGIIPNPSGNPTTPSPCTGVNISFVASMDGVGSILIANPQGGYDYEYSLNNSPFQESQVFNGPYSPGSFLITVRNGNGCIRSEIRQINNSICQATVTDADGNVYNVVGIGTQCWMAENLRFSGSIPQVTGNANWESFSGDERQPAWCYYDDNSAYNAIYGKLYNWYAVNSGNLCPSGWHIPTDADWQVLTNYLGGFSVAGGKMKSTSGWNAPNTDATNSSGFLVCQGVNAYIMNS